MVDDFQIILREKIKKGFAWSAAEQGGKKTISFIVFLVLARLLDPEIFGLVAMATVFQNFLDIFLDQGMVAAIVQRSELEPEHLDTAFWANLIAGTFLTLISILLSSRVGLFYDEPRLVPIIRWLSLAFILSSFGNVQMALLRRSLNFKGLGIRVLGAKFISGSLGVILALSGFGVWSLVVQTLSASLSNTVFLWLYSGWRPKFQFSKKHFFDLFSFGINMLGVRLVAFFDVNFDKLIIGYLLGPIILGYYQIAYRIFDLIQEALQGVTYQVVYAAFSKMQDDIERLRSAFYKITGLMSLIVIPVFIGIAILAPDLIRILFSSKWNNSIRVLQILAYAGIPLNIFVFCGSLATSLGKPKWHLIVRIIVTVFRVIAFVLFIQWGIAGVASAYLITTIVIYSPLNIIMANRLIKIDFRKYFNINFAPLLAGGIMALSLVGLRSFIIVADGGYLYLAGWIVVGAIIYISAIWFMQPDALKQLIMIASSSVEKKK